MKRYLTKGDVLRFMDLKGACGSSRVRVARLLARRTPRELYGEMVVDTSQFGGDLCWLLSEIGLHDGHCPLWIGPPRSRALSFATIERGVLRELREVEKEAA